MLAAVAGTAVVALVATRVGAASALSGWLDEIDPFVANLVLMTGPGSFRLVFPALLAEARRSASFRARLRDAASHALALKRRLGLRAPG